LTLLLLLLLLVGLQVHAQTLLLLLLLTVSAVVCRSVICGLLLVAAAELVEARTCCPCHDQLHRQAEHSRTWKGSKRANSSSNVLHVWTDTTTIIIMSL
jgi:hypothetical protein